MTAPLNIARIIVPIADLRAALGIRDDVVVIGFSGQGDQDGLSSLVMIAAAPEFPTQPQGLQAQAAAGMIVDLGQELPLSAAQRAAS